MKITIRVTWLLSNISEILKMKKKLFYLEFYENMYIIFDEPYSEK